MPTVEEQLTRQINEVLALELAWAQTLEGRADQAVEATVKAWYTERLAANRQRIGQLRLELRRTGGALDHGQTTFAGIGANVKSVLDSFRDPHLKWLHDVRDDFVTAQAAAAAYVTLENMAGAAGNATLAELAQRHRQSVEEMAAWLWHSLQSLARQVTASATTP